MLILTPIYSVLAIAVSIFIAAQFTEAHGIDRILLFMGSAIFLNLVYYGGCILYQLDIIKEKLNDRQN